MIWRITMICNTWKLKFRVIYQTLLSGGFVTEVDLTKMSNAQLLELTNFCLKAYKDKMAPLALPKPTKPPRKLNLVKIPHSIEDKDKK